MSFLDMPALATWTGGSMSAPDALAKLRDDGFPVVDIAVPERGPEPTYVRKVNETHDTANGRYLQARHAYWAEHTAKCRDAAGGAALTLIARHAAATGVPVEWRNEKGAERAVLKLAEEHGQRFPGAVMSYVIGSGDQLAGVASQGIHYHPGAKAGPAELLPGVRPRAYLAFMATTLVLCPQPDIAFPVIVAHDAYAVGVFMPRYDAETVTVGIMPRVSPVGVVGATAEQVIANLVSVSAAPDFNAASFKDRLRLRRKLAAADKSDNLG